MATEIVGSKIQGPSGFLELDAHMLVVDYGKIYGADGSQIGYLYEDGLIEAQAAPFDWQGEKAIEQLTNCKFRGIDSRGLPVELPDVEHRGPLGVPLNVLYGRICTQNHRVVGFFKDDGAILLRDYKTPSVLYTMDDNSQLNTAFQGVKANGQPMNHEWIRPLHKKDRNYIDNEIIRYFKDYEQCNQVQKAYVLETMRLWAASGLLQIVRKSEGDCAMGNVKHGASGVTGVRTGNVTLDRDEFETEIRLYRQYGSVAKVANRLRPYSEVRINLVVSHEYGHQLEFTLSHAYQDKVTDLYNQRLQSCNRLHPLPEGYEGFAELLLTHQIEERVFISGYARTSMHEYWAECVAAFSVKESREMLRNMDPAVYQILYDVVFSPEKTLSPLHEQDSLKLQTSLRVGGHLTDDLLAQ
jgi:hypothetical protein